MEVDFLEWISTQTFGQLIKIKIGSIIDKNGFITSLTYTVPDEISWDIAHEKPIGIDVSVGATLAMY